MNSISGKQVLFNVQLAVYNPNRFRLVIIPSTIQVSINDQLIGDIKLLEKAIMSKKDSTILSLPLEAQLADGALTTLLMSAMKDNVDVHITGKIKAGRPLFKKNFKLDESFQTSGKNLKLGTP